MGERLLEEMGIHYTNEVTLQNKRRKVVKMLTPQEREVILTGDKEKMDEVARQAAPRLQQLSSKDEKNVQG